jgi:hypothetical protein
LIAGLRANNKRKKRHMSRTLDGNRQCSLVLAANTCSSLAQKLSSLTHVFAQHRCIFVIRLRFVIAKLTIASNWT